MTQSSENPWLNRLGIFTAAATLLLIGIGGSVTSHEAGLAVPDWPTTYGHNMFLFPVSQWIGGVFYEHTHRLVASAVGLLTATLAVWIWLKEPRAWVRWLGVIAFSLVVLQGILGGVRVTHLKAQIGIVHAALAQLFLVLVSAIALFTSKWWQNASSAMAEGSAQTRFRPMLIATTAAILVQLLLGATMRHQHAGLAVPDFPLAYGKVWPPTDDAFVAKVNQSRIEVSDYQPITAFQIVLHMAHRLWAVVVLVAVGACAWSMARRTDQKEPASRLSAGWFGLVLFQAVLGASTVWSNKSADIATAHVVVGALCLVCGSTLSLMTFRPASRPRNKLALPDSQKVLSSGRSRRNSECAAA